VFCTTAKTKPDLDLVFLSHRKEKPK
jgi:hypothetical protein